MRIRPRKRELRLKSETRSIVQEKKGSTTTSEKPAGFKPPQNSVPERPISIIRGVRRLNRAPKSAPCVINQTLSGALADSEYESPPKLPKRPAFKPSMPSLVSNQSSNSVKKTPRRGSGLVRSAGSGKKERKKSRKQSTDERRRKRRQSRRVSNESTASSSTSTYGRTDSNMSLPGTPGSVDGSTTTSSSSSSNKKRISSGSDVHDKRVIRAGRLLKNKRKARDLWKWVDLLLTSTYLQYSYRRNIVGAIIRRKKHKFLLKSEFTSITRESPCIFALHRPIEAPFQFRCASAEECDGWFNDIQGALRPYLEERSLAKKNLILSDAGNVASNMNSAFKTTTPIKMIDLGLVWKKKRFFGTWGRRRLRLDPRLLSWSLHIGDHIASSSSSYL